MRSILALVISMVLVGSACAAEHVVAFVFDWDDNVFEMPTKIMLFHKQSGVQRGVSTEDFALMRELVGKAGTPWAEWELRPAPKSGVDTGSLRFFGDSSPGGPRQFLADVALAMRGPGWQGPVWKDFVSATDRASTARQTYFITARLHAPETIHGALASFHRKKLIGHTPPVDNIWAVAHPGFAARFQRVFGVTAPSGSAASPSGRKAAVMEQILDRIERTPLPADAPRVISPGGTSRGAYHLWGFSDDDHGNYSKAVEVLQKGVDAGRWPHVKLTVFYTGTNRKDVAPHSVVLRPNAKPRTFAEGPHEWQRVLEERARVH